MCRVLILTDASNIKGRKTLEKVINHANDLITSQDRHGFGWIAQGELGQFGERTTKPNKFLTKLNTPNVTNYLGKHPFVNKVYEKIGRHTQKITGALLFHGRTSTNTRNLTNTHPIIKNGWSVIHNGIVTNHGPDYSRATTNDTEDIVHYMSQPETTVLGNNDVVVGIKAIEKYLSGYYAAALIDPQGRLHVIRDNRAWLCVSWINTIKSYVYATTPDLIEDLCTEMEWVFEEICEVEDNVYLIFDKNEVVYSQYIKPRGTETQWEKDKIGTSLHYLSDYSEDERYEDHWRQKDDKTWEYAKPKESVDVAAASTGLPLNIVDASQGEGLGKLDKVSAEAFIEKLVGKGEKSKRLNREPLGKAFVDAGEVLDPIDAEYFLEDLREYAQWYTIYDKFEREIAYEDFMRLDTNDKLQCILVDPATGLPHNPYSIANY